MSLPELIIKGKPDDDNWVEGTHWERHAGKYCTNTKGVYSCIDNGFLKLKNDICSDDKKFIDGYNIRGTLTDNYYPYCSITDPTKLCKNNISTSGFLSNAKYTSKEGYAGEGNVALDNNILQKPDIQCTYQMDTFTADAISTLTTQSKNGNIVNNDDFSDLMIKNCITDLEENTNLPYYLSPSDKGRQCKIWIENVWKGSDTDLITKVDNALEKSAYDNGAQTWSQCLAPTAPTAQKAVSDTYSEIINNLNGYGLTVGDKACWWAPCKDSGQQTLINSDIYKYQNGIKQCKVPECLQIIDVGGGSVISGGTVSNYMNCEGPRSKPQPQPDPPPSPSPPPPPSPTPGPSPSPSPSDNNKPNNNKTFIVILILASVAIIIGLFFYYRNIN